MKCLSNLERLSYPADLVMDLTALYRYKGKDFYYEDVLKSEMNGIIKRTIERDTFYVGKILNLNVTENRTRLIIRKNANPRTKDERVLANLKEVFTLIQEKGDEIELTSNEFLYLAKRIFNEVMEIDFSYEIVKYRENLLEEKKRVTKRKKLDEELNLYRKLLTEKSIEPTQLITNFYVDILHLDLYTSNNEFIALLIMYCLLFRERFNVFKYVSFFQMYFEKKQQFDTTTVQAGYNWEQGFSQIAPLNRLTIQMMIEAYDSVEAMTENYNFDKKIRKIDNVEATILKLGEVFTKEQIKNAHPSLSDSTINRALVSLKNQNKIRPNGTGRSATWVRLVPEEMMSNRMKQLTLFDILMKDNEKEE